MATRYVDRGREEVRKGARQARDTVTVTLQQPCFYVFAALLLVIMAVPFLEGTPRGRVAINILNMGVLIAAVGALGRGFGGLVIGLLLAVPAAISMFVGQVYETRAWVITSNAFSATFYFLTVSYLLGHALRREVLTVDKLYGAAAAFLMLGVLWAYFYLILLWFYPGALVINGELMTAPPRSTILYFSFVTLTATGMSDVMPIHPIARTLCVFEMVTGVLFIAVLIARLAGSYPPKER